jgi:DNA excision repair protein ERCC-2
MAHDRPVLDLGMTIKVLKIAVTDFGQKNLMTGDIDEMSGLSQVSTELGAEIHHEIQDRRSAEISDYRREAKVEGHLPGSDAFAIHITGRMDGIWSDGEAIIIEEIKSSLNVRRLVGSLLDDPEHPYILQTKIYGWLTWKQRGVVPRLQLLLVAAGSREETIIPIEFEPDSFSAWIDQRQTWLTQLWREVSEFKDSRKKMARSLRFPFTRKRPGQAELMCDVAEACKSKSQLLIQAPTGLGKTAGVMFPMLKAALRRSDKLFYITPKNSQLRETEKFLKLLSRDSPGPLGLIMTAKPKICMQTEVKCTPDACPFAKGHYDKVNDLGLLNQLRHNDVINADILRSYASQYEVCPYELGRQIMPWVDVIAGDYHYALSPRANLSEMAKVPLVQDPKPLLAIDEAHNLSDRAIGWYSHQAELIGDDIVKVAPKKIKNKMLAINRWLRETLSKDRPGDVIKQLNRQKLVELVNAWNGEMPIVLEKSSEQPEAQIIINEWFNWLEISELFQFPDELFFATKDTAAFVLNVHCVNAGPLMRDKLANFHAVVAFSATLKPFSFHQSMNGFNDARVFTKEYPSPFPAKNRRIIAIPQVSTAWRDRPRNLPRIVEVIDRVIALKHGNYMAFFPSFEMLRQALPLVKAEGFEVIEQPPSASAGWVQDVLQRLRRTRGILVMAVQGGVLSEGIDLPGEQLIGAFIIGPALSMVTPEREERRKILGATDKDGFAKAYGYPAMARSIQSAGRVIRSSEDRGIIIMMDPRFLKHPYVETLPSDWLGQDQSAAGLLSTKILSDISDFWSER